MKALLRRALARLGYRVEPIARLGNFDEGFLDVARELEPYTMTSLERLHALWQAVAYVERAGIAGDIVECGVWRGGSSMLACRALLRLGSRSRTVHLFDTFEGMPAPTAADVDVHGTPAEELLAKQPRDESRDSVWCVASLQDARRNLVSTGYPEDRLRFVRGRVEETVPAQAPARIAILRLDTDWYESTRHGLVHLLPRLEHRGVLIVDDYGHWCGARRAVDEVLGARTPPLLLHRIDGTGRIAIVDHP